MVNGRLSSRRMTALQVLPVVALFTIPSQICVFSFSVSSSREIVSDTASISPQERSATAKKTWETVALAKPVEQDRFIDLSAESTVYNKRQFAEFQTVAGTYFLNGLSTCQIGRRLIHPFEAHGFLKSMTFDGKGGLRFKTLFVETPLTLAERRLNVPLARGAMSSLGNVVLNALSSSERDTANLVVTLWPLPNNNNSTVEPMLIVAGDNGSPYCLHPETLQSMGKLEDRLVEIKGKKMLAHARIDQARQRLILCSSSFDTDDKEAKGGASSIVEFFEIDSDLKVTRTRKWTSRFMVFHDWMITDNYYVVPKNPATLQFDQLPWFILGAKRAVEVFAMDNASCGELVLIPRHGDGEALECKVDSFSNIFHFGPSFEADGKVTVYGSVFDHYTFGGEMGFNVNSQEFDPINWGTCGEAAAPRLDKFVLDPTTSSVLERQRMQLIDERTGDDVPIDMPTFNGDGVFRRYSYFLGASRPEGWFPFRSIVKADLQQGKTFNWDIGDDCIASEPMFIPRVPASVEDDGFVVSVIHNASTKLCELMVWDSQQFNQGPIAAIPIGELMPWCVHGRWIPGFVP